MHDFNDPRNTDHAWVTTLVTKISISCKDLNEAPHFKGFKWVPMSLTNPAILALGDERLRFFSHLFTKLV